MSWLNHSSKIVAEKITESFGRYSTVAYAVPVRLRLYQRQEPQIAGSDLFEEPIYLGGISDIPVMDHAEYIEGDSGAFAEAYTRASPAHG